MIKYHYQCKLKKGNWYTVSWIPEKYTKVGKYISLEGEDGWQIIKVYSKMDSRKVHQRTVDYKNQRKVSDI